MKLKLALLFVVVSFGCGGSSPTAPTPPTLPPVPSIGHYSVTVTPNPILATTTGRADYPWRADWRVTITDDSGLSGNVNRVITTARNNSQRTAVFSDLNPSDVQQRAGTSHINAHGSLTYLTWTTYTDGQGGQQLTLTVAVEVIDDSPNHNKVTASTDVNVTQHGRAQ